MFKVNLETELLKENRSLVSAKELLLIKEYDSLGEESLKDETLQRVFGETSAVQGAEIKKKVGSLKEQTKSFDQSRVFHISQIETICKKYHLRFLPSIYYKGTIDKNTGAKISQFEIATGVKCCGGKFENMIYYNVGLTQQGNTFIVAPQSSFKLEERPKDPLLFYQINEQYYYLIHKWGNDLSVIRRLYRPLSNLFITWLIVIIPLLFLSVYLLSNGPNSRVTMTAGVVILVATVVFSIRHWIEQDFTIVHENNWRSTTR